MAFVAIPNGVEVVLKAHVGTDARANVLHFQNNAGTPMSEAVPAIANLVGEWLTASGKANVSNGVLYDAVVAKDISVADGVQASFSMNNAAGNEAGQRLPGNVCALVSLRTAAGGRSGRGRIFWFDGIEEHLDNATWNPTYVNAITTVLNILRTASDLLGYHLAVASRKNAAVYPVVSVSTSTQIATQRDRLPGRRAHKRRTPTAP